MGHRLEERIATCIKKALPVAFKTSLWFLKIMLPVSFVVLLLSYFDILPYLSSLADPFFVFLGLPGNAALVFITSIFTNIYTVIALMSGLEFTVREGIILSVMCLISHNYLLETIVQSKTGSSAWSMVTLRLLSSFAAALILNAILPDLSVKTVYQTAVAYTLGETLLNWCQQSLMLIVKVVSIITLLMIMQRLLEEFGVLKKLSALFAPLMLVMGLSRKVSFLWVIGNTLGLAYGSAVILDYARQGKMSNAEVNLLNYHLAVSHSQLEDPLLFSVLGLPVFWLLLPRFFLAIAVVWLKRIWDWGMKRYRYK